MLICHYEMNPMNNDDYALLIKTQYSSSFHFSHWVSENKKQEYECMFVLCLPLSTEQYLIYAQYSEGYVKEWKKMNKKNLF